MAAFTSTGEGVLGRQVCEGVSRAASLTLQDAFELNRCVAWVRKGGFSKVCLQFPDELLGDAAAVAETLTRELGQLVYILGDTTYGSCCVDEVAAEHVGADAVIHFGNTCLSPSQRLPVLYVPTRLPVCVPRVVEQAKEALKEEEIDAAHPLVLLFDVRCQYVADEIFSELRPSLPDAVCSRLSDVCGGEGERDPHTGQQHHSQAQQREGKDSCCDNQDCRDASEGDKTEPKCNSHLSENTQKSDGKETENDGNGKLCESRVLDDVTDTSREAKFNGRSVLLPPGTDMKDCKILYVGPKGPTLDSLLLRFAENAFYHASLQSDSVEKVSGVQSLLRRNVKLETIRDAGIIGILVGTLGVSKYREAITRLKNVIKSAGKRCYTFVVGKPNEPKLANISEVDVFVYVTCPETTLVDRLADPVLYRKLVAPWEVEVALLPGQEWRMSFETDFSALLPGGVCHVEVCEGQRQQEEVSVSLITNQTQVLGLRASKEEEEEEAGPVVVQDGKALAALHVGGGGQVLGGRSWAGLDPGQPAPSPGTLIVEGRKGIAAAYQDEEV